MMYRLTKCGLLLALSASHAAVPRTAVSNVDHQPQPAYDIGEFNKAYWRWKRCLNRWEQERGSKDAAGATKICGAEPKVPK